MKTSASVVA